MAWFWTDDLARALVEAGAADRSSVESWVNRPVALAGPDGSDLLDVARSMLGFGPDENAGAA